ncbi:FAD-binding oxidoreductase [Ktedonospora formicarum]|uniref:FAD-binding oxidoreductase n=1 Tax=Ktedonospora formicarum TaxID=2778364 RepID=UPI001C68D979|nr:FAD-dependent oxidoreductase [Ktedonospora formicarum]
MNVHVLTEFNKRVAGKAIVPGSDTYEKLRNVFNQVGSPAAIVRAQTHQDIMESLLFAREQHLPLSVRSGGHGLSGQATNTGGLVLDLAAFNQVELLDRERRLVRLGAGARWGEAAKALAAYGLAISSGDTNQVGVGGLTLGGGVGWMVRTYGLTIDSLHAAELITADGHILRVSAQEHPDLFWAIRGGGGNFGVVTSFDFSAHPCKAVIGGSVNYDAAEAASVLTGWATVMSEAPEELNSTVVLFSGFGPQVPPRVSVLFCYAGDDETAAHVAIEPLLHLGLVQTQDIQKKPYDAMLEDAISPPPSLKTVGHNGFLKKLSQEAIAVLANNYGKPGKPIAQIRSLGGAMARVSPQATAFAHRESEALIIVPAFGPANATEEQANQIRQAAWGPLNPLTQGAFINFLSDASEASVSAAYPGETYTRLANVKAAYDPGNLFSMNQNIKPKAKA